MKNPIGITGKNFRLTWQLASEERNIFQEKFRVILYREEVFSGSESVIYDSGERAGQESALALPDLPWESGTRYFWDAAVKIRGKEVWIKSEKAFFELGLLNPEDWKAVWIEPRQQAVRKEEEYVMEQTRDIKEEKLTPCPLLKKEFLLEKKVVRARAYATAHGLYRLHINGKRVGDYELTPEVTSYHQYLQAQTYDVTDLLQTGENEITAVLAPGWWAGRIGLFGHSVQYGDRLALLLQMEIWYEDGTRKIIGSDGTFLSTDESPWIYSELYIGEKYDAGKTAGNWTPAEEKAFSFDNLVGQNAQPMRVVESSRDVKIYTSVKGETIIDCKQVRSGSASMRLKGKPFAKIRLYYFEETDADGCFLFPKLDGCYSQQTDTYVLDETGEGFYDPWFTTHGYRYIYVVADQGEVEISDVTARLIASDVAVTAKISSSDGRLDRLQKNIEWTLRANATAILTDNPDRERAGWTGDLQMIGPVLCYNLDMPAFLRRWLQEARGEQRENGRMPMVIPAWPYYDNEQVFLNVASPGWGDVIVILPWLLYERYGDTRILRDNYGAMKRYVEFEKERARRANPEDVAEQMNNIPYVPWKIDCTATAKTPEAKEHFKYLWNTDYGYGDWLTPSACWNDETQQYNYYCQALCWLTGTYYFAYSVDTLIKTAGILGETEDAAYYSDLLGKIRTAAIAEFYNTGLILDSRYMGAQILALHMKFYPEGEEEKLLRRIVELMEEKGLDTGFSSTKVVFDVLCENGYDHLAYQAVQNDRFPSWLYEVEKGATSVWESMQAIAPDGTRNAVSFCQPGYTSVGNWLMEGMCGIRPLEPGFSKIEIRPYITDRLTWAEGAYQSVKGEIRCKWKREKEKTEMEVSIPANTSAVIHLPQASEKQVTESGVPLCAFEGGRIVFSEKGKVAVEVGSGQYRFCY